MPEFSCVDEPGVALFLLFILILSWDPWARPCVFHGEREMPESRFIIINTAWSPACLLSLRCQSESLGFWQMVMNHEERFHGSAQLCPLIPPPYWSCSQVWASLLPPEAVCMVSGSWINLCVTSDLLLSLSHAHEGYFRSFQASTAPLLFSTV